MHRKGSADLAGAFVVAGALIFAPTNAGAYCRTTTGGLRANCTITPDDCCTVGKPLYWTNVCVGYSLQKDGTKQMSFDRARTLIANAFQKWSGVSCPFLSDPSKTYPVSIGFRELPVVSCSEVGYNKTTNVKNQNVIVFRDQAWPHMDSANVLGLTTVGFDPNTGELFDADVEFNTAQRTLTANDPVPIDGYDFDSVVTHELGHFIGLAHSADQDATMFTSYNKGSTAMRSLAPDDLAAICSVYLAPDSQPGAQNGRRATADGGAVGAGPCDPEPRHGFSTECHEEVSSDDGCAIRPLPRREPGKAGVALALGVALAFGVARRARPRA
ncbi:matrixin family metalloprotease [Pendulispora albinea]|uniref:Matrixin family metalloprotease n=1 Tax=Pendulispora albinea TaxID=2741071 RepID=A0ABZ2LZR4_9BACT